MPLKPRLKLEAVAYDTDGRVKPIDQLSYKPPGKGAQVVAGNIKREIAAGRPPKQAVAIALAKAKDGKK